MTIKEQTRRLWKLCFSDSEEFMDLYFSRRFTDQINRFIQQDGAVIAALQVIPYTLTFGEGREVPVGYVSGACTHPDFRNRGYMMRLLNRVHRQMFDDGLWFSSLIPAEEWLKDYYRRSGYEVCFHYFPYTSALSESSASKSLKVSGAGLSKEVQSFFDVNMHKRQCCIQHTKDDLDVVLQDLTLAGGKLYAIYAQPPHSPSLIPHSKEFFTLHSSLFTSKDFSALAFCMTDGSTLNVKEILLRDDTSLNAALDALMRATATTKAVCFLPTISEAYPLGMARVINVDLALKRYAELFPQTTACINIVGDNAIPQNNGCRVICDGECVRINDTPPKATLLTLPELTKLILKPLHPYMSLMMN